MVRSSYISPWGEAEGGHRMRIGLLGAGTVGSALAHLLVAHADDLAERLGERIEVAAVLVRHADRPHPLPDALSTVVTTDAARVVDEPSVEVVVEAMGGTDPALAYARRVLRRGASLVTANKALIAGHGPELFTLATAYGGDVLFEGAVAAAVPVVGAMQGALSAARLEALAGVLNGSTNFLLALLASGVDLAGAVAQARRLGYLEADPRDDLDGHDAARKLAILASLANNRHVPPGSVPTRGIAGLEPADVEMAAALGAEIKLLAVMERSGASFSAWVAPALVPADHPLAAVRGAANAVLIAASPGGQTLLAGQGAGGGPTAAAVAGDVLTAARRRRAGARGPIFAWRCDEAPLAPERPVPHIVRLRLSFSDPGARRAVLAQDGVAAVAAETAQWLAVTTHSLRTAEVEELRGRLRRLPHVAGVGTALVRWTPFDPGAESWWRAGAAEPLVAAAMEGAE